MMSNLKKIFKIVIKLTFAFLLFAFNSNDPYVKMEDTIAFKQGLTDMAASTNSIKADFSQQKYLSILSNKIESRGEMTFKKPNLLKWEYKTPFEYIIVLNGQEIVISDEGKVNAFDVSGSKVFKQINEMIVNSVQGNIIDEEQFNIEFYQNSTFYLTKLFPKKEEMKKYFEQIEIYFSKTDFSASEIKLMEPGGDYTLITFVDKKMNESVEDNVFTIN